VSEFQVCLEIIYRGDELCNEGQVPPVREPILGPHVHCCRADPDTYLEELEVVDMVRICFWNEKQERGSVRYTYSDKPVRGSSEVSKYVEKCSREGAVRQMMFGVGNDMTSVTCVGVCFEGFEVLVLGP